jgi:hypothetical protein
MPAPYLLTCPWSPDLDCRPDPGAAAPANSPLLPLDSAEAPASSYRDISDLSRINAAISGWQFCRAGQQDRT